MNSNCNSFLPDDAPKKGMRKMSEINIILFEVHRKEAQNMISEPSKIGQVLYEYGKLLQEWTKVQAILTAAKNLTARVEYPESWYPEAQTLFAAVHNLKEMEKKK